MIVEMEHEDSVVTEIGELVIEGVTFTAEKEIWSRDETTGDFRLLFDETKADFHDLFGDVDFLRQVEVWARDRLGIPQLDLQFRESGAQDKGFVTFEF